MDFRSLIFPLLAAAVFAAHADGYRTAPHRTDTRIDPFAPADTRRIDPFAPSITSDSPIVDEAYTRALDAGISALGCLKSKRDDCTQQTLEKGLDGAARILDTPAGRRALEEALSQEGGGPFSRQTSRELIGIARDQIPALKQQGSPTARRFGRETDRPSGSRAPCMDKNDSLLAGMLRCGANAAIDSMQKNGK